MKVVTVLGTRPEVIKLAPVIAELRRRRNGETVVVATGQHRELLDQMLAQFELSADVDLDLMRPGQRLSDLTAELVRGLGQTLRELEPDWVVVQGDTSTTMCASLAAFYEAIPVAHVEAGLRTGDHYSPFPEELNRRVVSRIAALHFCPTAASAANLVAEAVPDDRVHVTGNTVIDALTWAVRRARRLAAPVARLRPRRLLVTLHRRESQGEAMRAVCEAVRTLAARGDTEIVLPVHRNPAVREIVLPALAGVPGVHLCEPLDYLELVHVLDSSDLVLTDSGGLQEEAPSLGKPLLVLRETTERPEAVAAGVARVVGTNPQVVVDAATELLDDDEAYTRMAHPENPFGDGLASRRIVNLLAEHSARAA